MWRQAKKKVLQNTYRWAKVEARHIEKLLADHAWAITFMHEELCVMWSSAGQGRWTTWQLKNSRGNGDEEWKLRWVLSQPNDASDQQVQDPGEQKERLQDMAPHQCICKE